MPTGLADDAKFEKALDALVVALDSFRGLVVAVSSGLLVAMVWLPCAAPGILRVVGKRYPGCKRFLLRRV